VLEHLTPNTAVQEEQDIAIHAIQEETAGRQAMQQEEAMQDVCSHQAHSVVITSGHPRLVKPQK
jgi:hypothetical protein